MSLDQVRTALGPTALNADAGAARPAAASAQPALVPRIDVLCAGLAGEMGLAQGEALRPRILAARAALRELQAFRVRQPWWLPYPAYRMLSERRARRIVEAFAPIFPETSERLHGIARGAQLSLPAAALLNVLEPVLSSVGGCTACPGACSTVAVLGRRSALGETLIGRNFDYLPLVQPFYILRDNRPRGGFRYLDFTLAPLAGAVDGLNEHGLSISYDYAFATDVPAGPAAPLSMILAEALARCRDVAEAVAWIVERPRWGGGLLMLADAAGDVASLELSSTRSAVRRAAPAEGVLFHTNAFTTPHMEAVQVPRAAVYTERAPAPLRGRRLHLSSERRDARFRHLLAGDERLAVADLARIMADHGPAAAPDDFTPCVHGSYWFTTASLQIMPQSRCLRVAYETACRAQYADFSL
jgi:hypothetical protein